MRSATAAKRGPADCAHAGAGPLQTVQQRACDDGDDDDDDTQRCGDDLMMMIMMRETMHQASGLASSLGCTKGSRRTRTALGAGREGKL